MQALFFIVFPLLLLVRCPPPRPRCLLSFLRNFLARKIQPQGPARMGRAMQQGGQELGYQCHDTPRTLHLVGRGWGSCLLVWTRRLDARGGIGSLENRSAFSEPTEHLSVEVNPGCACKSALTCLFPCVRRSSLKEVRLLPLSLAWLLLRFDRVEKERTRALS